jgi:hypothetical protein
MELSKLKCTMLRAKTHAAQVGGRGTVSVFETNPSVGANACEIWVTPQENFLVKVPGIADLIFIPGGDVAHAKFRELTASEYLDAQPEKITEVARAHEAKPARQKPTAPTA